jgi:hypothetical protein
MDSSTLFDMSGAALLHYIAAGLTSRYALIPLLDHHCSPLNAFLCSAKPRIPRKHIFQPYRSALRIDVC